MPNKGAAKGAASLAEKFPPKIYHFSKKKKGHILIEWVFLGRKWDLSHSLEIDFENCLHHIPSRIIPSDALDSQYTIICAPKKAQTSASRKRRKVFNAPSPRIIFCRVETFDANTQPRSRLSFASARQKWKITPLPKEQLKALKRLRRNFSGVYILTAVAHMMLHAEEGEKSVGIYCSYLYIPIIAYTYVRTYPTY